jgi:hypothetical protein
MFGGLPHHLRERRKEKSQGMIHDKCQTSEFIYHVQKLILCILRIKKESIKNNLLDIHIFVFLPSRIKNC